MASVQSVGGTPGINESGLVDLLRTGMLIRQQNNKDKEDRKQGNDDLIKAGISSKTMRPAKDGEKGDFTDSQGRGWIYDDTNLKEEHEQLNNQRKDAHWITINANVEKELQDAINTGRVNGQDPAAVNAFRNGRLAQYLGVSADGKISKEARDDLSIEGQSWVDSLTASKNPNINKTQTQTPQAFLQHAGIFANLFGQGDRYTGPGGTATPPTAPTNAPHPGRTYEPSPSLSQPIFGPALGGGGGNNRTPGIGMMQQQGIQPGDPNMQALLTILASQGQQPPMMRPSNPYLDGSGVPLGPVTLGQPGQ